MNTPQGVIEKRTLSLLEIVQEGQELWLRGCMGKMEPFQGQVPENHESHFLEKVCQSPELLWLSLYIIAGYDVGYQCLLTQ